MLASKNILLDVRSIDGLTSSNANVTNCVRLRNECYKLRRSILPTLKEEVSFCVKNVVVYTAQCNRAAIIVTTLVSAEEHVLA